MRDPAQRSWVDSSVHPVIRCCWSLVIAKEEAASHVIQ
jgi:hypothetical protein